MKRETYSIHSALLSRKSEYFSNRKRADFSDGSISKFKLPDVDPGLFALFVKWVYTEDVAPFSEDLPYREIADIMIDLYTLGDQLLCTGLKNRTVDILQEAMSNSAGTQSLELTIRVYASDQLGDSNLALYLLEQLAWEIVGNGLERYMDAAGSLWIKFEKLLDAFQNAEFKLRIDHYSQKRHTEDAGKYNARDPKVTTGCRWHEHAAEPMAPCARWIRGALRSK